MIKFTKVKYKNFGSVGNAPVEIDLAGYQRTCLVGTNGAGKSTFIDAICFGLFGRSLRNANKPSLVNSINRKNCVVEISFTTKGRDYMIRRGMRPNIFEIYMDNELVNQTASARDYQAYIEENVLKLNFNSFRQIVVLGSNNFVPFMRLPAARRREIIEDLLDITVFSRMNILLRDRQAATKDNIRMIEDAITLEREKLRINEAHLDDLRRRRVDKQKEIFSEIARLRAENETKLAECSVLADQRETLRRQLDRLNDALKQKPVAETALRGAVQTKRTAEKHLQFYMDNDDCPTCRQAIDAGFKAGEIEKHKCEANSAAETISDLQTKLTKFERVLTKRSQLQDELDAVFKKESVIRSAIQVNDTVINRLSSDSVTLSDEGENDIEAAIATSRETSERLTDQLGILLKRRETETTAHYLLKDTGIKTQTIRNYIPYMNRMINEYLSIMDFYVSFELDENFNETIRSRFRDEFSYENFSEGEKQRIDLAILFTWRQIAKQKNSMACNLAIFDEIGDSSLDDDGMRAFFDIMRQEANNTNFFVISHKEGVVDSFDRVLRFEKINNFSRLTEA